MRPTAQQRNPRPLPPAYRTTTTSSSWVSGSGFRLRPRRRFWAGLQAQAKLEQVRQNKGNMEPFSPTLPVELRMARASALLEKHDVRTTGARSKNLTNDSYPQPCARHHQTQANSNLRPSEPYDPQLNSPAHLSGRKHAVSNPENCCQVLASGLKETSHVCMSPSLPPKHSENLPGTLVPVHQSQLESIDHDLRQHLGRRPQCAGCGWGWGGGVGLWGLSFLGVGVHVLLDQNRVLITGSAGN